MKNDGIECEMRIIIDDNITSMIHDRWIISSNKCYNTPSPDVVARGQVQRSQGYRKQTTISRLVECIFGFDQRLRPNSQKDPRTSKKFIKSAIMSKLIHKRESQTLSSSSKSMIPLSSLAVEPYLINL